MTAAYSGNLEVVKLLLARGASVNAKENLRGQTALMLAIAQNHVDVAKLLIGHDADVKEHSKTRFTALLFAAQQVVISSAPGCCSTPGPI